MADGSRSDDGRHVARIRRKAPQRARRMLLPVGRRRARAKQAREHADAPRRRDGPLVGRGAVARQVGDDRARTLRSLGAVGALEQANELADASSTDDGVLIRGRRCDAPQRAGRVVGGGEAWRAEQAHKGGDAPHIHQLRLRARERREVRQRARRAHVGVV